MGKLSKAFEKAEAANSTSFNEDSKLELKGGEDFGDSSGLTARQRTAKEAEKTSKEQEDLLGDSKKRGSSSLFQRPIDPKIIVYHKPDSLAAEHFKVLRASIFHPPEGREIKSILITSAMEQEGKTMTVCNLAVSIAQSVNPYVLVIDADARRPNVHNMLGMENRIGLTDYLESESNLSNFLQKSPIPKLTVLTAGSQVRNPAEIMTSEKMYSLLEETRQRYDDRFIIVDSPPAILAAETITLSKYVDGVILVVRYAVSTREAVEEAVNRIGREKILGIVFNAFEVPPRRQSYYRKYGSGYGYGYGT